MNSELRGSRILDRYHQAHNHLDEIRYHEENVGGDPLSPTRRTAYHSRTKSTATERIKDDLTLGYHTSERNPREYEPSPASSRSFRIVSLDGCYEEQVSPLTRDSSSSISSHRIRDVPMIPAPPRCVMTRRENIAKRSKKNGMGKSLATVLSEGVDSEQNKEEVKIARPPTVRRRSSHSRSNFVFDGNLSFGAISPSPMYPAASPMMAYSSPPRASFPGTMVMNYPPTAAPMSVTPISMAPMTPMMPLPMTPMAPISPPQHAYFGNVPDHREQQQQQQQQQEQQKQQQQNQGRKTLPPTPKEQRRRNRAMPSVQYESLVFNQLRQEQQQHDYLQRHNTW